MLSPVPFSLDTQAFLTASSIDALACHDPGLHFSICDADWSHLESLRDTSDIASTRSHIEMVCLTLFNELVRSIAARSCRDGHEYRLQLTVLDD